MGAEGGGHRSSSIVQGAAGTVEKGGAAKGAGWQRTIQGADMAARRLPRLVHEWLADQADGMPTGSGTLLPIIAIPSGRTP
jgi:hypothetical protein